MFFLANNIAEFSKYFEMNNHIITLKKEITIF